MGILNKRYLNLATSLLNRKQCLTRQQHREISLDEWLLLVGVVQLEDEGTVLSVDLTGVEGGAVVTEAPAVTLHPAALIEAVKVVLPVGLEFASARIVRLDLDVVVAAEPGHASVTEVVTPAWEGWCPEVHHQDLLLGEEVDILGALDAALLRPVQEPGDRVRSPLNDVLVPVGAGLEVWSVVLVLLLPLPDDVC